MSSSHAASKKTSLHPAYCFRVSPTYNIWVKLTAADLHALRKETGFEGQNVYFHLNHPIRYAQLVGAVVAIDDTTPKFAIVTIDDGSGATINVKIARLTSEIAESVDCPSNTEVDNVNVVTGLGTFAVLVDDRPLDIASVIKVKGTISTFRNTRQLELKRVLIVQSTDEEASFWSSLAAFKREVLSRPWTLRDDERQALEAEIHVEGQTERELEREHQAKWKVYHAKMRVKEEKEEQIRRKEEIMMNAGALPGI